MPWGWAWFGICTRERTGAGNGSLLAGENRSLRRRRTRLFVAAINASTSSIRYSCACSRVCNSGCWVIGSTSDTGILSHEELVIVLKACMLETQGNVSSCELPTTWRPGRSLRWPGHLHHVEESSGVTAYTDYCGVSNSTRIDDYWARHSRFCSCHCFMSAKRPCWAKKTRYRYLRVKRNGYHEASECVLAA